MRIAISGFTQEALQFSPTLTRMADLRVQRGQEILDWPAYGLRDIAKKLDVELVPLVNVSHLTPSGVVEESAYLQLREENARAFAQTGPLDGICLLLHGAMLVENIWSGETDWVRSIRAVVGNAIPIAVRLDMHANLTEEFASKANLWTCFRTAPHRDMRETLERALTLLVKVIRNKLRPLSAFIRVPLLLQGEKATTNIEPMKTLLAEAAKIEAMPGILNADVHVGFGWADSPHAGSNVVVAAESEAYLPEAKRQAKRLAQMMWDAREQFTFDQEVSPSIDDAIERVLKAPEQTVFVTDSGDNPTAGAPGDTPLFLARLIARNVPDAVIAPYPDGEATKICFTAGVGATVNLTIGGKMDRAHGETVRATGVVEHLYQPQHPQDAAMATVRIGGVRVVLTDIRRAFHAPKDFHDAGIDPLKHKMVVVKLGYLMAPFREVAPREILVISPGYSDMDLTRLPYKYVTRPVWPLDRDMHWRPMITNVVGYVD